MTHGIHSLQEKSSELSPLVFLLDRGRGLPRGGDSRVHYNLREVSQDRRPARIVCFNWLDLYHKPLDSGELQEKLRGLTERFDPVQICESITIYAGLSSEKGTRQIILETLALKIAQDQARIWP